MRHITIGILILLISVDFANLSAQESGSITWESGWKNGYYLKSSDGQFDLSFGGRFMYDGVETLFYESALTEYAGAPSDGIFARRARFFNSGRVYGNVNYKLEFDFSGGSASLKCACIRIDKVPYIGRISFGHLKEPFGMEENSSSRYITFMERSLTSLFTPSRNAGIMLNNQVLDERFTWAVGAFRDTDSRGLAEGSWRSDVNFTARVTSVPWKSEDGEKLLHVGFAFRRSAYDSVKYSSSPGVKQQPDFVNTGNIGEVSGVNTSGIELATAMGPLSLQAEYISNDIFRTISDTVSDNTKDISTIFSAFYAYGSVFLTRGDRRPYSTSSGTFGRVAPQKNLGKKGGWGALELAARYSRLDLVDGKSLVQDDGFTGSSLIAGGIVENISVGVNWYLNPVTRIMVNYVYTDLQNAENNADPDDISAIGNAGFLQTRFQFDF
ncbi:MAG: porin [Bacteroidales bacterium]